MFAAIIGLAGVVVGALLTSFIPEWMQRRREYNARRIDEQKRVYYSIISPYAELLIFAREDEQRFKASVKKLYGLEHKMREYDLVLFASEKVLDSYYKLTEAFIEAERSYFDPDRVNKILNAFYGFLTSIRRELQEGKTKTDIDSVVRAILRDYEDWSSKIRDTQGKAVVTELFKPPERLPSAYKELAQTVEPNVERLFTMRDELWDVPRESSEYDEKVSNIEDTEKDILKTMPELIETVDIFGKPRIMLKGRARAKITELKHIE